VTVRFAKIVTLLGVVTLSTSCGDFVRQGRSPVLLVVKSMAAGSGGAQGELSSTLQSDVLVMRTTPDPCTAQTPCPTIVNDIGEAVFALQLKDPGSLNVTNEPSLTNAVTINRYRVEYRRTDGRFTQGVDVPFAFDSAITVTVMPGEDTTAGFQIVRHSAKAEAPLAALARSGNIISTIATVTFFGRDQAGNEVTTSANIGIDFGDFADED
jgi:hypothetical protein